VVFISVKAGREASPLAPSKIEKQKLPPPQNKQTNPQPKQKQPTTGPSPYLVAPPPPTGTLSAGDLSSSQPYWRDPNRAGAPVPSGGGTGGPRQGESPPVGDDGAPGPSPASPAPPSNGTSPGNGTTPGNGTAPAPGNSTLTRGAQLLLPAASRLYSVDPFSSMALGIAGALLPPVLAAKAAELANAAAAKVFAKKAASDKRKKASKLCPLSPADRGMLSAAAGAALGAGAGALAESATPLELARCAVTLRETKPAAFQWVLFSGGRVNPCSIVLGELDFFFF